MDLAKFTPAQSGSLVANVVGGKALPPGLAAQIVARTDGVPLFVEELTKTILESGDLIVEGDRYAYAGSSANVTIPETLRDSLMARLDRVAASKEIAQVGSVIGREFSYELIAGLELMSEEALGRGTATPDLVRARDLSRRDSQRGLHVLPRLGSGRRLRLAAEKPTQATARRNRPSAGGALAGKSRDDWRRSCSPFTTTLRNSIVSPRRCGCAPAKPRLRALPCPKPSPICGPACRRCRNCGRPRAATAWKSRCEPRSDRRWWRNAVGPMRRSARRSNPPGRSRSRSSKARLSADPERAVGALHVRGPAGGVAALGGQAIEGRRGTRRRRP